MPRAISMPRIARPTTDFDMKTKRKNRKIWLGVGAFVVVGATAPGAAGPLAGNDVTELPRSDRCRPTPPIHSGPSGRRCRRPAWRSRTEGRRGGEEGGEKGVAKLPPALAFGVRIALLRGHLLVGDELVKQQQWNAALPHFLHPGEEIYADIKDQLAEYKVPPFERRAQGAGRRGQGQEGRQRLRQGAQIGQRSACRRRRRAEGKARPIGRASWSSRRSRRSRWRPASTRRRSSKAGSPSRSSTRTRAASSGRPSA